MLYCHKPFGFAAISNPDGKTYNRSATGSRVVYNLDKDDILVPPIRSEKPLYFDQNLCRTVYLVESLDQVRKSFLWKRVICGILTAMVWVALVMLSIFAVTLILAGIPAILSFIPAAVMAVLAAISTPQNFNPVVHDCAGNWINLRTGDSNLNGGCRLV